MYTLLYSLVSLLVKLESYGKAYDAALREGGELAATYARPRVEPQWDIATDDRLRRKIALEISKLSQSMNCNDK